MRMTKAEFDSLPYREDLHWFVRGYYRDRAFPDRIFIIKDFFRGPEDPSWTYRQVVFID